MEMMAVVSALSGRGDGEVEVRQTELRIMTEGHEEWTAAAA